VSVSARSFDGTEQRAPLAVAEVLDGLSRADAERRFRDDGANELVRAAPVGTATRLLTQLGNPLIALLVVAAVAAAALGERTDAIAIALILIVNAAVGFVQEHRAERAIAALGRMTAPRARVIRDGGPLAIAAREVVRGDVLALEAGDVIAADAELVRSHGLAVNEVALTGESIPADKSSAASQGASVAGEQTVFMGTAVVRGTALARVRATGMHTELGRIARLIETAEDSETPLQRRLDALGRVLTVACAAIVLLVAAAQLSLGPHRSTCSCPRLRSRSRRCRKACRWSSRSRSPSGSSAWRPATRWSAVSLRWKHSGVPR